MIDKHSGNKLRESQVAVFQFARLVLCPGCAVALRTHFQSGSWYHGRSMVRTRQGNSSARVNRMRSHCVIQTGKTQFKSLLIRHGRDTAGHILVCVCELA